MCSAIVRGNFSSQMRSVQLRIWIRGMTVSTATRGEEHVTAVHGALVHLAEVHGREVDLERALITERLQADVALHAFLAGRRRDEGDAEVVPELLLQLGIEAFAGGDGERT